MESSACAWHVWQAIPIQTARYQRQARISRHRQVSLQETAAPDCSDYKKYFHKCPNFVRLVLRAFY
jgi:hypothetical protein